MPDDTVILTMINNPKIFPLSGFADVQNKTFTSNIHDYSIVPGTRPERSAGIVALMRVVVLLSIVPMLVVSMIHSIAPGTRPERSAGIARTRFPSRRPAFGGLHS